LETRLAVNHRLSEPGDQRSDGSATQRALIPVCYTPVLFQNG